jgi:hypothetical protein
MRSNMAGQVRHLKVKDGRFYARIAVPASLRALVGRSELTAPLGGERRAALKLLPEAVAGLQRQLALAAPETSAGSTKPAQPRMALNVNRIALRSYTARLEQDTNLRETNTAWASLGVDTDYASRLRDGMAGKLSDTELDELVGNRIAGFRDQGDTDVMIGSTDWRRLAIALCASEYEALERVAERDEGNFTGTPRHPVLQPLDEPERAATADLLDLWEKYVAKRQKESFSCNGRLWVTSSVVAVGRNAVPEQTPASVPACIVTYCFSIYSRESSLILEVTLLLLLRGAALKATCAGEAVGTFH